MTCHVEARSHTGSKFGLLTTFAYTEIETWTLDLVNMTDTWLSEILEKHQALWQESRRIQMV